MKDCTGFYPREQRGWRVGGMSELLCGSWLTYGPSLGGPPGAGWIEGLGGSLSPNWGPTPALAALLLRAVTP